VIQRSQKKRIVLKLEEESDNEEQGNINNINKINKNLFFFFFFFENS